MHEVSNEFEKRAEEVFKKLFNQYVPSATVVASTAGKDELDSLEYFYKVRDSAERAKKKVLTYVFNDEIHQKDGLILVPITDVHLGHKHANIPYFKQFVQYILDVPNCVTILNGDLAETATRTSVGMAMFEEDLHLPDQIHVLYEILKPLAEAGKILGMGPGNHEERMANLLGLNPMKILADRLNVPYFGYQGFFKIVVNGIPYKCVFHHGVGGGATSGSKTNAAEKMNKVVTNADLYFSGHTHGRQFHTDIIYVMDENSDELIPHKRTYVVGGSFLDYEGYPAMKALPPSDIGAVRVQLMPHKKDVRVFL